MDQETERLIKEIYQQAKASVTNHIMFTFGSDFQYMNARMNFDNMDKLIKYTNQKVLATIVHNELLHVPHYR